MMMAGRAEFVDLMQRYGLPSCASEPEVWLEAMSRAVYLLKRAVRSVLIWNTDSFSGRVNP